MDEQRQRGWLTVPGDPPGVARWFDGSAWTERTTSGELPVPADAPLPPVPVGVGAAAAPTAPRSTAHDRGWRARPGDPDGVLRWHDGTGWTNRVTGGPPRGRPRDREMPPAPVPFDDPLPSVASTVVVTFLFGIFGIIPAAVNTAKAKYSGRPTSVYWAAFWWTVLASVVFWVLFAVMVMATGP